MAKFRKKPVVIDATNFRGTNIDGEKEAIQLFFGLHNFIWDTYNNNLIIPTLEDEMIASPGDWIIKGVNGEYYPCKPDIFVKTYDQVL
jgi:hypothetical protein